MMQASRGETNSLWIFLLATVSLVASAAARAEDPARPEAPVDAAEMAESEEPAALHGDEIVVTAGRTEQRLRDLPVHASFLGHEELERSAVSSTDDFLRQLPSFNSERPGSSRGLDPANQAVTFRGLGGSSASRALVLVDGVPLNEPFAGWVSWSRIPLVSVERIEVIPGPGAGAWGNQSLGGVIHLITRRPEPASLEADLRYGSRNSFDGTVLGSHVSGPIAVAGHISR